MSSGKRTSSRTIFRMLNRRAVPVLAGSMIFTTGVAVTLGCLTLVQRTGWDRIGVALEEYAGIIFWTGLAEFLALVAGLVVFFCASRKLTAPLARLARQAARLTAEGGTSSFDESDSQPLEIQQLSKAFNELFATRERQTAELRELTRNVLHDLRTPLTHIRLNAELVHGGKSEPGPAMETIAESCNALIGLVDTHAEISANYARTDSLPAAELDLVQIVEGLVEMYSAVSEARHVSLDASLPSRPIPFRGHRHKLQRLLANLMDNAFKFTPEGGSVRISAETDGDAVRLCVSDTGIGIGPKDVPHIYERFYRADFSRHEPGSGLGLSLVHAIVTFYHGTIDCRSAPGAGTTFAIVLPPQPPA